MSFFFETLTKEAIKQFRVDQMWRSYHGGGLRPDASYCIAIDRERSIYFMFVHGPDRDDGSHTAVLNWKGKLITVRLIREDGSKSFDERPFRVGWKLLNKPTLESTPQQEILQTLKEALTVYSRGKIWARAPDAIVNCYF